MAQVIELYSTMNSGHEVYIAPNDPDHYNEIEKVATEAYDHWFSVNDEDDPAYYDAIGTYIANKLEEAGFYEDEDYTMEFGEGWDAD